MVTPTFCCGAECGAAGHLLLSGTNSFTTTVRSGTGLRSLRFNPTTSTSYAVVTLAASQTVSVRRIYVKFDTLPSATTEIFTVQTAVASKWCGAYFKASDSKIYAGTTTAALGATGVSVTTGTWYRVDVKVDVHANPHTVDVQVDGSACGQATAADAADTFNAFTYTAGFRVTSVTADMYVDDWIDSNTAADYPIGAGYVKSYIPNADGTHNVAGANDFEYSLTGTDITNASTDVYTLIDERPLPTTAVDFINGIAPPNATDYVEWQYEDSTESVAPRAVEAIVVHHDAGGAGTNNWTVTLRESGGGTSGDIWTGTTNVGATITYKRAHFATVPGTATAWDTTKFNALRSRFLVADASPDVYIDAAMLEVEFPEVAAATPDGLFDDSVDCAFAIVDF